MVHFWAKTTPEGKPGISVFDHIVNVGCVARCIAEMWPEVLEYFHFRSKEIGGLAALHDLDKISPGFQRKCLAWLEENGLMKVAPTDAGTQQWNRIMAPFLILRFRISWYGKAYL
jgi:CRISPR-associated endonuclease/helicase Cas3